MNKLLAAALCFLSFSPLFAQSILTDPEAVLPGHSDDIEVLTVSPSGNWIATGSRDKNVNIYKGDSTMELFRTISGFMAPITALRFSADGKLAVATNNSVYLYDSVFRQIRIWDGHTRNINAFHFDNNGKFLYSGGDDGQLMIWDLATGKNFKTISNGPAINALGQIGDSRMLYVADATARIKIYSLSSFTMVRFIDGHTDAVNAIDISRNNQYLLSGSNDKSARLWDLKTGKEVRKLQVDCWKVTTVAFTDDSRHAVTGCNDGSVKVWEVATGKLISKIEATGNNVRDIAFIHQMKKMAVASMLRGSTEYGLRIWQTGIKTQPLENKASEANDSTAVKKQIQLQQDSVQKAAPGGGKLTPPAKK